MEAWGTLTGGKSHSQALPQLKGPAAPAKNQDAAKQIIESILLHLRAKHQFKWVSWLLGKVRHEQPSGSFVGGPPPWERTIDRKDRERNEELL